MQFQLFSSSDSDEVIRLFTEVFTESEGAEEGAVIGDLVSNLITTTAEDDLIGCVAKLDSVVKGCIFLSRFHVPSNQLAFILSPVAIASDQQAKGVGQQLINLGLAQLRELDVSLVFTYGDPAYYSKTGFEQLSENIIAAPYPLSQPIGWQAQSLDGTPIEAMNGPTECVPALSKAEYW